MTHIYKDKKSIKTLVLFHGTGADEHDMIPLGEYIDTYANILSIRGRVKEGTLNRYFKRFSSHSFDLDSLEEETKIIYEFLMESSKTYHIDLKKAVYIGYSNGANILSNLMMTYDLGADRVYLLHPMVIKDNHTYARKEKKEVIITAALNDFMVPKDHPEKLKTQLLNVFDHVTVKYFDDGHQISKKEIDFIKTYEGNRL